MTLPPGILNEGAYPEEYTAGSRCVASIETPCKFAACRATVLRNESLVRIGIIQFIVRFGIQFVLALFCYASEKG